MGRHKIAETEVVMPEWTEDQYTMSEYMKLRSAVKRVKRWQKTEADKFTQSLREERIAQLGGRERIWTDFTNMLAEGLDEF